MKDESESISEADMKKEGYIDSPEDEDIVVLEEPSGSLFGSTSNLVNTVLGTGMLSMPYAFSKLGIAHGMVLLAATGTLAFFGLSLLARAAQTAGRNASFNALAMRSFPPAAALMDAAIAGIDFDCRSYLGFDCCLISLSSRCGSFL